LIADRRGGARVHQHRGLPAVPRCRWRSWPARDPDTTAAARGAAAGLPAASERAVALPPAPPPAFPPEPPLAPADDELPQPVLNASEQNSTPSDGNLHPRIFFSPDGKRAADIRVATSRLVTGRVDLRDAIAAQAGTRRKALLEVRIALGF